MMNKLLRLTQTTVTQRVMLVLVMVMVGGCSTQSTDNYNLCAWGHSLVGIGVGAASSGTGLVVAGAAAGGIAGYIMCREDGEPPKDISTLWSFEPAEAVDTEKPVELTSIYQPIVPMVVNDGPPGDGDGDGVTDDKDACPETPEGVDVTYNGCDRPFIFDSAVMQFASNSATLAIDAAEVLQPALLYLEKYPNTRFEVIGHTDSTGAASYNQALSERRAQAVVDQLIKLGIPEDIMSSRGDGEANPWASNLTEGGKARNRRVVVQPTQVIYGDTP